MKRGTERWAVSGYGGLRAYEFVGTPLEAAFNYAYVVTDWERVSDLWPNDEPVLYRAVTARRKVGA